MPFSGGLKEDIRPISKTDKPSESLEEFQKLQKLIEQEQALDRNTQEHKQVPNNETLTQIAKNLPRLIQKTLAKLEGAQVYQTFKLPGKEVVVHDRRERLDQPKAKEKDTIAEESKKPLQDLLLLKGKLIPAKEKTYENFLVDPLGKTVSPEQKIAGERLQQFLSRFEKMLLKRFEEGGEIAHGLSNGRFAFLKKTAEQWKGFFGRFVRRTVKRTVGLDAVQEWIVRGMVQRQAKATLISDWSLQNGLMEKYVRFRLPAGSPELAAFLAGLNPGTRLSKEELKKYLSGELEYLAIRSGEGEMEFAKALQKGKFLATAQAEEKVATDLGVQLGAQLKEKTRLLKGKKGSKFEVRSSKFEGEEQGVQFVPWWQFGPLKKGRGPVRWFVITFYLVLLSLVVIGILSLF